MGGECGVDGVNGVDGSSPLQQTVRANVTRGFHGRGEGRRTRALMGSGMREQRKDVHRRVGAMVYVMIRSCEAASNAFVQTV